MKSSKKKYRIIFNNDGGTLFRAFVPLTDTPFTVERFIEETIGYLRDTQVDVLSWTLGADPWTMPTQQGPGRASNMYFHNTEVGERFHDQELPFQSRSWYLYAQRVKKMIEEGNDPPKVVAEHGHKSGLDVFCAFRMNDCHDGRIVERAYQGLTTMKIPMRSPIFQDGQFNEENIRSYVCKLKREHPELLIGEHEELTRLCYIAFDYSHEMVRDFRLALIEEACEKYDIDGVELDFLRHPIYFKPGEEKAGLDIMSGFIGKVRAILDRAGESRGKHLALAVRTLAPLEASRDLGLDAQSWLEENWLDALIVGREERNQLQLDDVVEAAHEHDCPIYASIRTDSLGKHGQDAFRAIAANHYRAGADGIYLFNMSSFRYRQGKAGSGDVYSYKPLSEIGSFEDIQFKDKYYFLDNKGAGHRLSAITFDERSESLQDLILRSEVGTAMLKPEVPVNLEEDKDVTIHFRIADNYQEAHSQNLTLEAELRILLSDLTGGEHLVEINLNGKALPAHTVSGKTSYRLDVPVDSSTLKCGENVLKLSLKRQDPNVFSELRLNNVEVLVKYHERGE